MQRAARIEISPRSNDHAASKKALFNFRKLNPNVEAVKVVRVLTVDKEIKKTDLKTAAGFVLNPVIEKANLKPVEVGDFDWVLEIGFLPGVTDNVGTTAVEVIEDALKCEFTEDENVYSSQLYFIQGELTEENVQLIAENIANPLIERIHIKDKIQYCSDEGMDVVVPKVNLIKGAAVTEVDLNVKDRQLEEIGKKGIQDSDGSFRGPLALTLQEMQTIKDYFRKEGRNPTDVELESIAQTWSEHCSHKIFASPIDELEDGLYKGYIKRATKEVRAQKGDKDFCVSVFKDNSGAIDFNEKYLVTDKAETHNSPSALDPYGGAITGIVGVNRDSLGFGKGAKPVLNRYGFCFADPRDTKPLYRGRDQENQMLPPKRIIDGVIRGVEDGGNQSGIPGPQGFLYYNERYKGKPLVFVGTVGLIPKTINGHSSSEKSAQAGDLIVMIGGRVGQDGIHGATFSSESLDGGSPSTAVQIGDPITQKRFMDAILNEVRDQNLYSSITDNGAGGISCSVAEMAEECGGCEVELEKVPLKYPNLEPWKIWISESQERMTLAVPEQNWDRFQEIMDKYRVEATVIGRFNDSNRCVVRYEGATVMDLDMEFLHNGTPLPQLKTNYQKTELSEPEIPRAGSLSQEILQMMGRMNIASFANVSTVFDHEVQGGSIVKPLQGLGKVNGSATVYKPDYNSWKGIVISQGLNPLYSDIDTYHMAASAIDTAIRNAVAAGGNIDHMALMDNFCWCSSNDPYRLGQLKEAVRACYEYAVGFGTPYISGKDSMFNDFSGYDGDNNPVQISVPPTLLVSSLSVVEDVRHSLTMDPKVEGDLVYVIGETKNELGGSEYYYSRGELGANVPQVDVTKAVEMYRTFYLAVRKGLLASAMSVSIGGLGAALGKMVVASKLGLDVDLRNVDCGNLTEELKTDRDRVDSEEKLLFSETQSRIVVTINPTKRERFEALFRGHSISLIGRVTKFVAGNSSNLTNCALEEIPADSTLKIIGLNGELAVNLTADQLAREYFSSNKYY